MTRKKDFIGQLLKNKKLINEQQLEEALSKQRDTKEKLGQILLKFGYLKEDELLETLAYQLDIPYIKLSDEKIDLSVVNKIPVKFAHRYKIMPIREEGSALVIAMEDPLNIHLRDDIRLLLGYEVKPVLASGREIIKALRKYYGIGADTMEQMIETTDAGRDSSPDVGEKTEYSDTSEDTSIIKFVNQIILEAYNDHATDIHIEPFENELRVRYRIDGVLHEIPAPSSISQFQASIISRIKIMADLNIAEKRLPQDGRIKLKIQDEEVDLRVSTIPTLYGESIDLRILPHGKMMLGLKQLGLLEDSLYKMAALIRRPHGIILVTGPTGSGKTTTLYACLNEINSPGKKIITIEDPVEYRLRGVNQIHVKPKINLTFANGLRAILRQDPDIIMVGEIRDLETAGIAIRASLTGHLVLSTLHTNDAPGSITRLIDMGIEPYLVSSSVEAILAQRLVRLVCPKCRESYQPELSLLHNMGFEQDSPVNIFRAGKGCEHCRHTGYKGRVGIFEFLIINDDIKNLILTRTSLGVIRQKAISIGMKTLRDDGWKKVVNQMTTIDEVLRVTPQQYLLVTEEV